VDCAKQEILSELHSQGVTDINNITVPNGSGGRRSTNAFIAACAIATSCCISVVPSQWESQKFDPPLLPHFSADLFETQNQE